MLNLSINPAIVRYQILTADKSQLTIIGSAIVQELQNMPVTPQLANRRYMLLRLLRFSRQVYISRYLK